MEGRLDMDTCKDVVVVGFVDEGTKASLVVGSITANAINKRMVLKVVIVNVRFF